MTTIRVADLTLRRRQGSFVLGPIDLTIESGARVAILGPSGCGKSTLLRCLAGLERPDAGRITFGDRTMLDVDRDEAVAPHARSIGFVFQDGALWPHLTAIAHLRFADPQLDKRAALALLDEVGLAHCAKRKPATMSGGERQRLALARALVGAPQVLMLDEPLHSVDVHLRDELGRLILDVASRHALTLLVVTHDRSEALALANRLVVLSDGRVVDAGAARELLAAPRSEFTATFLAGATCLHSIVEADRHVATPFGRLAAPSDHPLGPCVLAVLPADVEILSAFGDEPGAVKARVLQLTPIAGVRTQFVTLALDGAIVRTTSPLETHLQPDDDVLVRLRHARFLPPLDEPHQQANGDDT